MFERWRAREGAALCWALLGGGLLLAPTEPRLLALTGFLGLCLWCEALTRAAPSSWRAFRVGLVFGTAANASALFSLVGLLQSFAHLPLLAAAAIALLAWLSHGVLFALVSLLSALAARRGSPRWLSLPLALTAVLGLAPAVFPWHVAATQVGFLPFVQIAELGGESLVGLCLSVAACCLHASLRTRSRRTLTLAVAAIGLPCLYGLLRLPQIEQLRAHAPTLAIGVAQSNVGTRQKHDEQRAHENLQGLRRLTGQLEAQGAELTVWGETAYPYPLLRSTQRAPTDVRRVLGEQVHGPVLLGLETYDGFDEASEKYNSAWLLRPDGALAERVDKSKLLAFGEYIPFWDHLPDVRTRYASKGFAHGVPGTVESARGKLGVLICYEDLFAESARATVQLGARALVNLTNDAWFGDTREPFLHDTLARLRSIELRRDLVRAVNTGVSSFTSASGKLLLQTHTFERASFVAQVALLEEQTLYARAGNWLTPCCLLALLACLSRRAR